MRIGSVNRTQDPANQRVWGIGLSRTGTTSLADALSILGYRSAHFILPRHFERYEGITDTTVAARYRELDVKHPGSKFILTVREVEGWLRSYEALLMRADLSMHTLEWRDEIVSCRTKLYGTVAFDAAKCRAGYMRHVEEVIAYFHDRPSDLLILDIVAGQGWDVLCPFLGRPIPPEEFPSLNASSAPAHRTRHRAHTRFHNMD